MMSPLEIDQLADAVADRVASRLATRVDAEGLLDVHGVAELLACSVPTVERLTRSGELPSLKFGKLRRYQRAALLERRSEKVARDE